MSAVRTLILQNPPAVPEYLGDPKADKEITKLVSYLSGYTQRNIIVLSGIKRLYYDLNDT